jgi:hypothetical protein
LEEQKLFDDAKKKCNVYFSKYRNCNNVCVGNCPSVGIGEANIIECIDYFANVFENHISHRLQLKKSHPQSEERENALSLLCQLHLEFAGLRDTVTILLWSLLQENEKKKGGVREENGSEKKGKKGEVK